VENLTAKGKVKPEIASRIFPGLRLQLPEIMSKSQAVKNETSEDGDRISEENEE